MSDFQFELLKNLYHDFPDAFNCLNQAILDRYYARLYNHSK